MSEKPSIEEVLRYADGQIQYYITRLASMYPKEQRDEMSQDARIRVFRIYRVLRADKWPTYVQKHVRGAIKDYIRAGRGFEETRDSLSAERNKSGESFERSRVPLDDRLIGFSIQGEEFDPSQLTGINWPLLARMARLDRGLHLFVRHELLDQSLADCSAVFGVTSRRLGQRLQSFLDGFDDPSRAEDPWLLQIIYALGLCDRFGMNAVDQKLGWTCELVDFDSMEPIVSRATQCQLTMFDQEEEQDDA